MQDFGCGPFAMQFGYMLAIAESIQAGQELPTPSIYSHDDSGEMWDLGLELYSSFRREISDESSYSELAGQREACGRLRHRAPEAPHPRSINWLTVLHAAYPGEVGTAIKSAIDRRLINQRPEIVLVTANPDSAEHMYEPPQEQYSLLSNPEAGPNLLLAGVFGKIYEWRKELYGRYVQPHIDSPQPDDLAFARSYLTLHPTSWISHGFRYVYSVYERRSSGQTNLTANPPRYSDAAF